MLERNGSGVMRLRAWSRIAFGMLAVAAIAVAAAVGGGCSESARLTIAEGTGPSPLLPEPRTKLLPTVDIAPAAGWSAGARPIAADGLIVNEFAAGLDHPRWLYVLPNGDVLVAESNAPASENGGIKDWLFGLAMQRAGAAVPSADRITLLRDTDADGRADQRSAFLTGLSSPFGMALVGDAFYVANTDALLRFRYTQGAAMLDRRSAAKVADLPAGPRNHHWTRNVIASGDGQRLYVTVGSNSNVAEHGMEHEHHRAAILEIDAATGRISPYATGLRNPNGLAWRPDTGALWTVVNERDGLGSDLVPDYLTSVERGAFYGWPYSYFGAHVDERVEPQRPDLVAAARAPDYALGPHTAPLGLVFVRGALAGQYRDGAFVSQHGSWNRRPPSGYKVIFVPFANGQPSGEPVDVLHGFLSDDGDAYGRPVGLAIDATGSLLVADDVGNTVWRVSRVVN